MSRTVSSTEAQSNFGVILRAAKDGREDVIVKHYGEPAAVLISYADYEELVRLRQLERRQKVLSALDRLRDEVQRQVSLGQEPSLSPAEAYRLAGFSEEAVQSTLARDQELADARS